MYLALSRHVLLVLQQLVKIQCFPGQRDASIYMGVFI